MFTGYGICYRLDALDLTDRHPQQRTLQQFTQVLADPAFPCLFGRKAVKDGSCRIVFARAEAPANDIARGLGDYVRMIEAIPRKARPGNPLLVFLEGTAGGGLAEQQALAWKVLQQVHARDPQPWPQDVPRDPHDTQWSFCFAGMPLFINMSFPAHRQMKSRHLGDSIALVINPRESFEDVASALTESGQRIRARIRERVARYNDGVMPDTLGFFGQDDNHEWKQYQLQEAGSLNPSRCPFHVAQPSQSPIET